MMDDNNKDLDELVNELAQQRHEPPPVPRDRMWRQIDAARASRRTDPVADARRTWRPTLQWLTLRRIWYPAAVAIVLVVGISIGRHMDLGDTSPQMAVVPHDSLATETPQLESSNNDLVYQLAAVDLFNRADVLLTDFQTTDCGKTPQDEVVPEWAGGMLLQTRLLLSSPVAENRELSPLLEDLELVLAQIVGISANNCVRDRAWIREGLDERFTLDRLRVAADSGPKLRSI